MDEATKAQHAVNSAPVSDLASCYQKWAEQDMERNRFVQMLLQRVHSNDDEIRRLRLDLDAQSSSRIMYQQQAADYMARNEEYKRLINNDAYVAVLVDGDGAKFRDNLLRDPVHGAVEAAQLLKQQIVDHLRKDTPLGDDVPIFVRIFANVKGLAKALRISGVINQDEDMHMFAENLTNSRAEFDFVNVGHGKENADSKLRRMLNYYHKDIRCKKIFFIACHDGGYTHALRPYIGDRENRIVLVETTPAEHNIRNLGLPITRFDNVFRDTPLNNETKFSMPPPQPQAQQPPPPQSKVTSPPAPIFAAVPPNALTPSTTPTPPPSVTHRPEATIVSSGNGGVSIKHKGSYASAGGANGHQNLAVRSTKARPPKTIEFNADNVRLDPPVKMPNGGPAQDSYRKKLQSASMGAFCNSHYLMGYCGSTNCGREHEMRLTAEELSVHRYKARTSPCHHGPKCMNFDCVLSHHCPQDPYCTRGRECRFSKHAKYGNLHLSKEELKPVKRWTEGSDFPELL
ncbi:C-x8-C-x5-C-x3-H type zinc finger protein [Purpureocillium lilacinum]|uniref:C-x8-C-x5-C-x3-H type zinc finger protein n=1 Tax=Purpureocillium lilacinum TaxID=33203 RepID=A0A179HGJ1_PURLI|nr:C-x8-C-x5-C-x3-H type zinc finger protein [Purpureocillium lilacinum]OAQ89526.1 C-x8-C-x5-C-x3-H type zinc finger protein [Purpureocillium lilacinum]